MVNNIEKILNESLENVNEHLRRGVRTDIYGSLATAQALLVLAAVIHNNNQEGKTKEGGGQ